MGFQILYHKKYILCYSYNFCEGNVQELEDT